MTYILFCVTCVLKMPENEVKYWERVIFMFVFTLFNNYVFKATRLVSDWED